MNFKVTFAILGVVATVAMTARPEGTHRNVRFSGTPLEQMAQCVNQYGSSATYKNWCCSVSGCQDDPTCVCQASIYISVQDYYDICMLDCLRANLTASPSTACQNKCKAVPLGAGTFTNCEAWNGGYGGCTKYAALTYYTVNDNDYLSQLATCTNSSTFARPVDYCKLRVYIDCCTYVSPVDPADTQYCRLIGPQPAPEPNVQRNDRNANCRLACNKFTTTTTKNKCLKNCDDYYCCNYIPSYKPCNASYTSVTCNSANSFIDDWPSYA